MICQLGKDTVVCPLLRCSHQGSWMRKMSKGGSFFSLMMYIAACVAVLDLFMLRLHTDSSVYDKVWLFIGGVGGRYRVH